MGRLALKNVCVKRGRHKDRYYYRRKTRGKDVYYRLPDIDDPRFWEEYQRLSAPENVRQRPKSGTIQALVVSYRESNRFRAIKSESTLRDRTRYLAMIEEVHGHRSVEGCIKRDVRVMRDVYVATPGTANLWLSTFRLLMTFAVDEGWRADNPALGIKALDLGEHEPWPSYILEAALAHATPMTRLSLITGLCGAVRIGDAVKLEHRWIKDGILEYKSSKNKVNVAVPVHPIWAAEIEKLPRVCEKILYNSLNKPFPNAKALRLRIQALMEDIGKPTYISNGFTKFYSFHGLRKNAACYLAELGLSEMEIGAVCGMTPETVRHYTKRARSWMIARGAFEKITRGDVLPSAGGRN